MKEYFLKKAEENLPDLIKTRIFLDIEKKPLNSGDFFVLDLGNHYVGYFSFKLWYLERYIDAPVKIKIRFCETKREIDDDYNDYKGSLCSSWLQEDIVSIDFPGEYKFSRRYAARYIKITVESTPKPFSLSDFVFEAVSSADIGKLKSVKINDSEFEAIDRVAVNTLRSCMQRVFEDGPKRDRRLWIGDLRLEALANYYTFNNSEIVKRCLYLFAASERNDNGFIVSHLYENPVFVSGDWYISDYSLLYVCSLCDYYNHTNDEETFKDLFEVARSAVDSAVNLKDPIGLVDGDAFIDWCPGLYKKTAYQGVYLYTLDIWVQTLEKLRYKESEYYKKILEADRRVSLNVLFNKEKNAFLNEIDKNQYSVHSAVWMVLGGVIVGESAKTILLNAICSENSVKPKTPYMHHYVIEALMKFNLVDTAKDYIRNIWGGMVKDEADTFYEIYVPDDPDFSPYGDKLVNSACHAWSCSPCYFLRD
jgi:hypothetical protein